ncbi:hypothetical protein BC937DRAFT_93185 [Endogone sp. FLAS-F59071]|nr:hypothetical protein BC937DRAFT_93185 [Endogone sp. FLAS-F59071]|eukprot:RUS14892.1 hypothetical protein BC937DRAFT_93185 [Endogone sp. FLAS-F59071]
MTSRFIILLALVVLLVTIVAAYESVNPPNQELDELLNADKHRGKYRGKHHRGKHYRGKHHRGKHYEKHHDGTSIGCIATYSHGSVFQGYVSQSLNSYGEFGVNETTTDILLVSFDSRAKGATDIKLLNEVSSDFPLLGGIVGYFSSSNDLSASSANYVYLGATNKTAPNSPPASGGSSFTTTTTKDIESAIWTIGRSGAIKPQWVNTNKSKPATSIVLITDILILVGNVTVFEERYGPSVVLSLKFVKEGTDGCPKLSKVTTKTKVTEA